LMLMRNNEGIATIKAVAVLAIIMIAAIGASFTLKPTLASPSSQNTLVDLAGRTVTIPQSVNRIVVLQSYWAEISCTLGAAEKIVGIGKDVATSVFLPQYVTNKTNVGSLFSGINIETIVALNPDVVITDFGYGKAAETIQALESLNITVVALTASSFKDHLSAITIIGKVLKADLKAEALVNYLENQYSALISVSSKIPDSSKPRVLICNLDVWGQGLIYAYSNSSYGRAVVDAGGINVAYSEFPDQSSPKVNLEKILAWNPDIIIVTGRENSSLSNQLNLMEGTAWTQLKAYQEGKVYTLLNGAKDRASYYDWTPRMIVGLYQVAKIIHPDLYSGINATALAAFLMQNYYGYLNS